MNESTESKVQDTPPQVNEQRRRLTRGGLAAPIVLGTLLSRPVLGAAPYNCTISGQLSGNTSSHGDPVACNTLGLSPGFWKNHDSWPDPYVYGAPPAGQCPVDGTSTQTATPGTRFNKAEALGSTFQDIFRCVATTNTETVETVTEECDPPGNIYENGDKKGQCKKFKTVTTTTTTQTGCEVVDSADSRFATGVPATLLQVLQTGGGLNDTDIAALGRAAVASLLNAARFGTEYPLTGKQVIDMFNDVCKKGGVYWINDTVSWNASQVMKYFESLYGGKA